MSVRWVFLVLCVCVSGCTSLASLAATMNARHIASCIQWQGFVGSPLTGAQVQVRGLTVTDGATMAMCRGE